MSYQTIAIEITAKCRNCNNPIALNACVNEFHCSHCRGVFTITEKQWMLIIDEMKDAGFKLVPNAELRTTVHNDSTGTLRIIIKKINPICPGCKKPIRINNIDTEIPKIRCTNCSEEISQRKADAYFQKAELVNFIAEDNLQIRESINSYFSETPNLSCVNCGVNIKVDGKERLCICQYCNTQNIIPDTIWYKLHPSEKVNTWYASFTTNFNREKREFTFGGTYALTVDEEDILYCVGSPPDNDIALWAMTPKCELKWMKLLPDNYDCKGVELTSEGNLLVWSDNEHSAMLFNKNTGEFIKHLGGKEPEGSKIHMLDLERCESLATDPAGSIVAFLYGRILRFSNYGKGIATWPPHGFFFRKERLSSIYKEGEDKNKSNLVYYARQASFVYPQKLSNYSRVYSSFVQHTSIHISRDSSLIVYAPHLLDSRRCFIGGAHITKFNKEGRIVFKLELKAKTLETFAPRTDAEENIYIAIDDIDETENRRHKLFRIKADGSEIQMIKSGRMGISSIGKMAVNAMGTIYMLSEDGGLRIFSKSGDLIWRNKQAQYEDNLE
ncbi:MAG: hypothetical protein H7A25_11320 [Leptospiraceae bacterium]|nr:hypothetical protein [Leptospiraceae bacterium]